MSFCCCLLVASSVLLTAGCLYALRAWGTARRAPAEQLQRSHFGALFTRFGRRLVGWLRCRLGGWLVGRLDWLEQTSLL